MKQGTSPPDQFLHMLSSLQSHQETDPTHASVVGRV